MIKKVTRLVCMAVVLCLIRPVFACHHDNIPNNLTTPAWTSFKSNLTTYNGQPVPIGSIVDAFDPDGIHCGRDTVGTAGLYGFMSVYGDDGTTAGIDEGANTGDSISFVINCRPATATGDVIWQDLTQKDAHLAATATLAVASITNPNDTIAAPGDTIRFRVRVQNTGNGLDFYLASGSTDLGWSFVPPVNITYADAGESVDVFFDVALPVFPGPDDTVAVATFKVYSSIDTTVFVTDQVTIVNSVTDVPDDRGTLPAFFSLKQNYPNPFNPTTTIAFSLDRRSDVKLEVYNVLGQAVINESLGSYPAGEHAYAFDGAGLPSGVYFYRLKTSLGAQTRKMTLLK